MGDPLRESIEELFYRGQPKNEHEFELHDAPMMREGPVVEARLKKTLLAQQQSLALSALRLAHNSY